MFFFFSFFFFFRFFSFFFVSFSFSLSAGVVPLGSLLGSVSSVAFGSVWSLGSLLGSFLWGPCGFSPGFWSAFGCFGPCFWLCGSCRVGLWGRSGCLLLGPAFGSCFWVRLFGPRLFGWSFGFGLAPVFGSRFFGWSFGFGLAPVLVLGFWLAPALLVGSGSFGFWAFFSPGVLCLPGVGFWSFFFLKWEVLEPVGVLFCSDF